MAKSLNYQLFFCDGDHVEIPNIIMIISIFIFFFWLIDCCLVTHFENTVFRNFHFVRCFLD